MVTLEQHQKSCYCLPRKYASEILEPAGLTEGTGKVMGATLKN